MVRKKLEQEIDELRTHLRILSRTTAASIVDYGDVHELLEQIVHIICEELGYGHFGIGLADENGQVVYRAGCGLPDKYIDHLALPRGQGIVGTVLEGGQPLLVSDVRREPRYVERRSTTCSELCVPLRTHKRVIGVINAESDQPGQFTPRDLELLTTIANVVSGSLERLLERRVTAKHEQMKLKGLTLREREVLAKVAVGKSNKEIARELRIKQSTVEVHLTRIFIKLGVQSRTEAMAWLEKQRPGHP